MDREKLDDMLKGDLCRSFARYWWHLRDQCGGVPDKSAFDPGQVKPALPMILLHDLGTPGKSVLRLIGTAIAERYGFDATGHDYLEFVSPERRETAYHELIKTASHPCGMRILIECSYKSGKTTVGESIGFPFKGRDGHKLMMFCDQLIDAPRLDLNQREEPLQFHTVRERDYVDIGFGEPKPD